MKVLSLFSGVGGFDMGLENAGMETVFQCEWDKHCRTILDRHWPTVPKWDDVSTLTGEHILAHAPVIDVVAWGSPCQDLSVAGKRAGLEGGRSGLFYEGMRIITELRKASNGKYPRISIWENVYGALNSNKGEDFEAILKEMVEAGSLLCEWRVLDAQYFGVPQRRRRVFVVAVFDSATANRCPDPLLPVSEGLRWNPTTRTTTREEPADTVTASIGSGSQWAAGTSPDGDFLTTSVTSKWHKGSGGPSGSEHYNMVVEESSAYKFDALSSNSMKSSNPNSGCNEVNVASTLDTWRPDPSLNQGGIAVVETFTKSRRAQSATDDETWVEGKPAPTLNSFDQGDVRATTVIVNQDRTYRDVTGALLGRDSFGPNHEGARDGKLILEPMLIDGRRINDVRVYESPVQTLEARMGTGGNNTPMVAFSHTQGLDAQPSESAWPTLRKEGNGHAVAIPIQDGREIEKNQNGLGVAEEGAPAYTIDQTGAQAVAYGIQGNMIGRQDHNGPAGKGHTEQGDPMFTLNTTDKHAVAFQYDGYNQTVNTSDVSQSLRIGRDSSDFVAQPSEPTTMVVRRLTPLECERLMGWPDDHTRHKADGTEQADTHRYKQCGNGVASPVAQWIGEQLINL
jgi:DNA-cytosine methyltransferase